MGSLSAIFFLWVGCFFFSFDEEACNFVSIEVVVVVLLCVSVFMKEEICTIKVVGLIPTKSVHIANALAGPYSALK